MYCESDNDVATCLKYGQQHELDLVIACGRHSYYGASSTNGGLVIGKCPSNAHDTGPEH